MQNNCFSQLEIRDTYFVFVLGFVKYISNRLDFNRAFLFRIEERYDNSIYMIVVLFKNVFFLSEFFCEKAYDLNKEMSNFVV